MEHMTIPLINTLNIGFSSKTSNISHYKNPKICTLNVHNVYLLRATAKGPGQVRESGGALGALAGGGIEMGYIGSYTADMLIVTFAYWG
jgi:hypothetical protein